MSIRVAVISDGLPQPTISAQTIDDLELFLRGLGFVRDGDWLPDEDFGFDKSTTFRNHSGISEIVCVNHTSGETS